MTSTQRKQVVSAIQAWAKSYGSGDVDAIMEHFVPGTKTLSFGTGPDEVVRGARAMRRQITRDLLQVDSVAMTVTVQSVAMHGAVAWFGGKCTMRARAGKQKFVMPGRITGVLQRIGKKWLVDQIHYSMAYTPQAQGSSWA